jgi:hypothetical protein
MKIKIISLKEAKRFFKQKIKVYQIFDDGSSCIIENERDFNDVVESKTKIGINIPN